MTSSEDIPYAHPERRLRRLLRRLPGRMQAITRWLRKPASRWARIPAGILLILGGCLAILPVFGLWMLPLGLMLLADDIPPLRRGAIALSIGSSGAGRTGSPQRGARGVRTGQCGAVSASRSQLASSDPALRGQTTKRRARSGVVDPPKGLWAIDFTPFLTHF